jgi:hypothetical protein
MKAMMILVVAVALLVVGSAMDSAKILTVSCNDNSCLIQWDFNPVPDTVKAKPCAEIDQNMTAADYQANVSEDPADHGAIVK